MTRLKHCVLFRSGRKTPPAGKLPSEVFFMHKQFEPKRVLFEEEALNYPLGRKLWEHFACAGSEIKMIASHNRVTGLPGKSPPEMFKEAKRTLVVGVHRSKEFASCRPSGYFQVVISTCCRGLF